MALQLCEERFAARLDKFSQTSEPWTWMKVGIDPDFVRYFFSTRVLCGNLFSLVFRRGRQDSPGKDNFVAGCVHAYLGIRHVGILAQRICN